jgi:hypothetical protein
MTKQELEEAMLCARDARTALSKPHGFMPPKLWHKLERARAAVDLLSLELQAVKAGHIAKELER